MLVFDRAASERVQRKVCEARELVGRECGPQPFEPKIGRNRALPTRTCGGDASLPLFFGPVPLWGNQHFSFHCLQGSQCFVRAACWAEGVSPLWSEEVVPD